MNISDSIVSLYPEAIFGLDYEVRDLSDGRGPRISAWNETKLGPRPTQAQLDAAALPAAKARRKAELSREATRRDRALFPDSEDVALEAVLLVGTNDPRLATMRTIKQTLDARRAAVDAAATEAAVGAVVW